MIGRATLSEHCGIRFDSIPKIHLTNINFSFRINDVCSYANIPEGVAVSSSETTFS